MFDVLNRRIQDAVTTEAGSERSESIKRTAIFPSDRTKENNQSAAGSTSLY